MNRKLFLSLIAASAVAVLSLAPAFAANPAARTSGDDIKVKAEVDKAFLTIGDPVTYTITVEHSPDIQVISTFPAPDPGVLEIKKIEDISRKEGKKILTGRKFILTTYKLGEFVLDPVTIKYKKTGGPEKSIQTNKIYLQVKSIAEGETKEDIRDVKSVVPLTRRYGWILITLGVVGSALIVIVVLRNFRKRNGEAGVPESPLTPDEQALADLRALFDSDVLKRGFVKLYYLRLSEILRVYLEKRYGILAVESTTFEILRALKDQELPKELREKLNNVLSSSDLAKFAKWVPSAGETTALNKQAEEIVLESAPAQLAAAPEAGEVSRGV